MRRTLLATLTLVSPTIAMSTQEDDPAPRARDLGIEIGRLPTGPLNALTDVEGVAVGHATIQDGKSACTGVTVILPCGGENLYLRKVPAAVYTANGYGKAAGFTQVEELGNIEAPIALTNTLAVGTVLDAMVKKCLTLPGNEEVLSINVVVGETNDGWLNDIRAFHVRPEHVQEAWESATTGSVAEGSVGAGTGTLCLGFKGGIGTSSRVAETWTVGVLVQANFGGDLRIDGLEFPQREPDPREEDGSCMIVVATDAPLEARQLRRLAKRTFLGLGRIGSVMSHGSGDYAIAFSTHSESRIAADATTPAPVPRFPDNALTPLFAAAVEATEEAVLNALVAARSTTGHRRRSVPALDHEQLRAAGRR